MKPVKQTKFGKEEGNCFEACLASLFEVDISTIPEFGKRSDWWTRFRDWCISEHDLCPVDVNPFAEDSFFVPLGYYIVNGESPRGDYLHSVINKNGELAHDPHPDGSGLNKVISLTVFTRIFE